MQLFLKFTQQVAGAMRMGISKVVHKQNLQAGSAGLVFAG